MGKTTFGDRLNVLFQAYLRPRDERGQRREWTNAQVARAAEHLYGRVVFTQETLRQARSGKMTRGSSVEIVTAIARAFAFLSETEPHPADVASIIAYLCIDPAQPASGAGAATGDADSGEDDAGPAAVAVEDLRASKFGRVGLLARLGDLDDPDALAAVEALVTELERRRADKRRG